MELYLEKKLKMIKKVKLRLKEKNKYLEKL